MRLFCVIFKHCAFDSKLQSLWKLAKLIILAFFKNFFCSENETFSEIFKPCVVCTKKTYQNQCWFHDDFSRTGWGYKPLTYLYIASKPNRFLLSSPNEMIFCFLHANFDPRKKLISGVPSCKCQLENLKLKFYHFSCHFIQERKVTCALSKHFFFIFSVMPNMIYFTWFISFAWHHQRDEEVCLEVSQAEVWDYWLE